jgi:hypothetical protein
MYEEGATAETVADSALSIVEDAITKMQSTGNPDYADLELSEERKADLHAELTEAFKTFESEDGTLDLENFTTDFILDMLTGNSEKSAATLATPLSTKSTSEATEEDKKAAELREVLTEKIMEALEGAEETIVMVVKIISCVILATFAIWLLPILKILLKLKKRNNAIRLGLPICLGSIPYVVLCLLPNALISAFANSKTLGILNSLSIRCSSCAMVSFIVGIVLAVFVLFFYAPMRKTLKRGGGYVQTSQPQPEAQPEQSIES